MAWPTTSEVELMLMDMGFKSQTIDPDTGEAAESCSIGPSINRPTLQTAAVRLLETATGYTPLIAPSTSSAEKFDAPDHGNVLFIKQALCAIDSVSMNGSALVEDADYWVYWRDGQATRIEFNRIPLYRKPKCVTVTGKWGRYAAVPDELKDCALRLMASMCIIEFRESIKAQPVQWNEGDVSERYGEMMLKDAGEGLRDQALADARALCFNAGAWF